MQIEKSEIIDEYVRLKKPPRCVRSNIKKYYSYALNNREKNRYKDVIPFNEHRVLLKNGAYINASYLPRLGIEKMFIACQAPLPSTIVDFYHMILDEDVCVVVMLTKLFEKSVKAHCYWPVGEYSIGDITIELLSAEVVVEEAIVIRKIQVTRGTEDPKVFHQIHYTEWKDNEIPKETSNFKHVIDLSRSFHEEGKKLIAHCSAGIGRAGSFLAVYSYIDHCLEKQQKTIFDIVNEFRDYRLGMVQTSEQYLFIYEVLKDILSKNEEQ